MYIVYTKEKIANLDIAFLLFAVLDYQEITNILYSLCNRAKYLAVEDFQSI